MQRRRLRRRKGRRRTSDAGSRRRAIARRTWNESEHDGHERQYERKHAKHCEQGVGEEAENSEHRIVKGDLGEVEETSERERFQDRGALREACFSCQAPSPGARRVWEDEMEERDVQRVELGKRDVGFGRRDGRRMRSWARAAR